MIAVHGQAHPFIRPPTRTDFARRCAAAPNDRSAFLADVAAALDGQVLGDGAVFRVIREIQGRYFHPPELTPGGSWKYGR
jgi:hypothetical protein